MVRLEDFDKITYKRPNIHHWQNRIKNIVGFDSEAYQDGSTFMFCTSKGDVIRPEYLFHKLFTKKYLYSNFVVWNLKYESGAILKLLPIEAVKCLQKSHITMCMIEGENYEISYIPHKHLKIRNLSRGDKCVVRFWDISPFYGRCKLEKASNDYLSESKIDMDPKLFTETYVKVHFFDIAKYCIKDAALTANLAKLWVKKFEETGISVSSLYSEASISFAYISSKTNIVTPWNLWEHSNKVVRLAFEAYEGGKFEVTTRGKFSGYEYDISSAYPYHIANLIDISGCLVEYGRRYRPDATYGYMRVRINNQNQFLYMPCGVFHRLRIYPMGVYYLTITKQEFDYLINEVHDPKLDIQIIDAAWVYVDKVKYPYKEVIEELYQLKQEWKSKDKLRSKNYKIIMNGFYGKMAQCVPDRDGGFKAGQGWNPLYASIITANTRIQVTRLQNLMQDRCLAVHTDSVITTHKIPPKFIGEGLGDFELVEEGDGVIVACGIYELGNQSALKGFFDKVKCDRCGGDEMKKDEEIIDHRRNYTCVRCGKVQSIVEGSIRRILTENPDKKAIEIKHLHVESWLQAMSQNHDISRINLFDLVPKKLTINCDKKRRWERDLTTTELLNETQGSAALVVDNPYPKHWKV